MAATSWTATAFEFRGNYATGLHRMMLEMQHPCTGGLIAVTDNVASQWREPWNDSFYLSIMPRDNTDGVTVENNFASNEFTGPWGKMDPGIGNRFGIFIETAWKNGIVRNNTATGRNQWFTLVSAASANTQCQGNRIFGRTAESNPLEGEPGFNGNGSIKDLGGNQVAAAELAPPVPAPDPRVPGAPSQPTKMVMTVAIAAGTDGGGVAGITVEGLPAGAKTVRINSRASGDKDNPAFTDKPITAPTPFEATVSGTRAVATITRIHPGWQLDFIATAFDATGRIISTSDWITTPNFPGNPSTPWPPTTQPSDPTTQPSFRGVIVTSEIEVDAAGKVVRQTATTKPRQQ
jgi:hypothetical protein